MRHARPNSGYITVVDYSYQQTIEDIVDRLYLFLGFVIIPVVAVSLLRINNTGWLPVYGLYLAIMVTILACSYNRAQMSFMLKSILLISMSYMAAVTAIVQFSVGSFALPFFLLFILLARITLGKKIAIWMFSLSMVTLAVVAYLTITGVITPSIEEESYYLDIFSWLNAVITFLLLMAMVIIILTSVSNILLAKSQELQKANEKLALAIDEIRTLRGIIPVCTECKKVRDDSGYWQYLESYIGMQKNIQFTHGLCDKCLEEQYSSQDWPEPSR